MLNFLTGLKLLGCSGKTIGGDSDDVKVDDDDVTVVSWNGVDNSFSSSTELNKETKDVVVVSAPVIKMGSV